MEASPLIEHYGPHSSQRADYYAPTAKNAPVVCLLHGGFWRAPYGREQLSAVALDLSARGFAVWNIGYRCVGDGGGWKNTFDDVLQGIRLVAEAASRRVSIDLQKIVLIGHSAGGHLALWAAGQLAKMPVSQHDLRLNIFAAIGLAPVADLYTAHQLDLGGAAVVQLLGGTPDEQSARFSAASPTELIPLGVAQWILHGTADDAIPIALSRSYVQSARSKGDRVELIELTDVGHMEFLDPTSESHSTLCRLLKKIS